MKSLLGSAVLAAMLSLPAWCQLEFETTGLLIDLKDGQWVVRAVVAGSSAQLAQVQPGDRIVAFRGAKSRGQFQNLSPETMGAMAAEFGRPNSGLIGLRIERGQQTQEVEVQRQPVVLSGQSLRGFPEGRVIMFDRTVTEVTFSGENLAYGDKVALVQGSGAVSIAEVTGTNGKGYQISRTGAQRNRPDNFQAPGPPQPKPTSSHDADGTRVFLLEHCARYYQSASSGRTASGRLDKPYVRVSPGLAAYDEQVRQGSLRVQVGTIRQWSGSNGTFVLRTQHGSMTTSGVSGSHIVTRSTFSSGDPIQELHVRLSQTPVWYSRDEADQGKDATSQLRNGQLVRVYYRLTGTATTSGSKGRKVRSSQGEAVLIVLE